METAMKVSIVVTALLLFFVGCTQQQSDQLTQQQKDQIKSEVKAVLDSIKTRVERLDGNGVMEYISPESMSFDYSGARVEHPVVKEKWANLGNVVATINIATVAVEVTPLTNEFAICSWQIKVRNVLKSGVVVTADPEAYSYVFKKTAGQWKMIHSHESATVAIQPPVKK
jgi:ketosteroid isomerase-like protein